MRDHMNNITDRQQQFLDFLTEYQRRHGEGPTFREIAIAMNVTSKGTITAVIDALVNKGFVDRRDGEVRGLTVRRKAA